jgi:hypothetical protein
VALLVVLVAGCATRLPQEPFDRAANADIKLVGLLEPRPTPYYRVANVSHVGLLVPYIGSLIADADMLTKTNAFTAAMKTRGLDLAAEYRDAIRQALVSRGYVVKVIPVDRPPSEFLGDYDGLDPTVDAYVDTSISGGYVCTSSVSDYLPYVRGYTRVVRRTTRAIVYQQVLNYGYEWSAQHPVMIAADPKYRFPDHAALMADPERAMAGLRESIPLFVDRTARDLSP